MGEGVGRQVPARSLGARSRTEPSNSLTTRADVPHPGLPRELPGMGCISARGPGPHCRWTALTQEGASSCQPTGDSAALPPSLGEWLPGQGAQTQGCRARSPHMRSLQDRWGPGTSGSLILGLTLAQRRHKCSFCPPFQTPPGAFMSCHKPVPLDSVCHLLPAATVSVFDS